MAALKDQLEQMESKQEYLTMKAEEGEHLRAQFELITQGKHRGPAQAHPQNQTKMVMDLSRARVEVEKLKTDQQLLRQQFLSEVKQYHLLVGESVQRILSQIKDGNSQCRYCDALDGMKKKAVERAGEGADGLVKTKAGEGGEPGLNLDIQDDL